MNSKNIQEGRTESIKEIFDLVNKYRITRSDQQKLEKAYEKYHLAHIAEEVCRSKNNPNTLNWVDDYMERVFAPTKNNKNLEKFV